MFTRSSRSKRWFIGGGICILLACSSAVFALSDTAMWDAACAKMESGDLSGAQALASDLLQQYPSSPKAPGAQLMLGRIEFKIHPEATQELLTAFSLVRTKYPTSAEAADALVHVGFLHSRSNTRQSAQDFAEFLDAYPTHPDAARVSQSLGRLYLRMKDLDKAEASFDKAAGLAGAPPDVSQEAALQSGFVKIMRFYATRDKTHLPAAIDALGKLASSERLNVRARADLGIAEATLLRGKPSEARELYVAAAAKYAGQTYVRGIALFGAACCSQYAGHFKAAVEDYAALLAAVPGAALADKDASWKTVALASTSASAQAAVVKDGAWQRLPGNDIVRRSIYERAWYLRILGRHDEAISSLEELLAYLPQGDALRSPALSLLERCRAAKEGK